MNIENLSINDLKVMAYDELARREVCEANLRNINTVLSKKMQEEEETAKKEVEKKATSDTPKATK